MMVVAKRWKVPCRCHNHRRLLTAPADDYDVFAASLCKPIPPPALLARAPVVIFDNDGTLGPRRLWSFSLPLVAVLLN